RLAEVTAADVWGEGDAGRKAEALAGRVAEVDGLVKVWMAKMDNPAIVDTVAEKLAELNTRRKGLTADLAEAQREGPSPPAERWGEGRTLADLLAADPSDELREKVRAALRRAVETIACLFVSGRGNGARLAAVQVHFRGSGRRRDYLVAHKPAVSNGHAG